MPFQTHAVARSAVVAFLVAASSLAAPTAQGQAPEDRQILGEDVRALQGIWESVQRSADGELRFVKAISGNHESFQVFRGKELLANHSADFEVALEGPVKVFRWKNGKRVGGPGMGTLIPDGGCVYRLEKDVWTCVFGALDGEKGQIYAMTYRRQSDAEPEAGGADAPAPATR
ncbi:MAG TPA: hypothetical protein VGN57_18385 [Pirellulaceae bacterium]|nr:hypothetical protein [Pirellulaceae bacterium]